MYAHISMLSANIHTPFDMLLWKFMMSPEQMPKYFPTNPDFLKNVVTLTQEAILQKRDLDTISSGIACLETEGF